MDFRLNKRKTNIENRIEDLQEAEEVLLNLEASEKTIYANLFLKAEGKNIDERKSKVETNQEYIDFKKGLAVAKVKVNRLKRLYDLSLRAGDWEYGTYKIESEAIKKPR